MQPTRQAMRILGVLAFTTYGGCVLTASDPPTVYSLVQVNGQPIPAPAYSIQMRDGEKFGVRQLEGKLLLFADGRFRRQLVAQHLENGIPSGAPYTTIRSGEYSRTDSLIVLRFVDQFGAQSIKYTIKDGGTELFGVEVVSWIATVSYLYRTQ